jgi:hypothetical protein
MIGQVISEADFSLEDHRQSVAVPAPRFQARMSLIEARATILAAMRALGAGGFSRRTGMITREVCGAKFGRYTPADILIWLRSDDFQQRFTLDVESWRKGWGPAPSGKAARLREGQYRGCSAFIAERGWEKLADAIESMLAARAQQVVLEDAAGNRRVQSLVDVLDLLFALRMTAARAARMKLVGGGE